MPRRRRDGSVCPRIVATAACLYYCGTAVSFHSGVVLRAAFTPKYTSRRACWGVEHRQASAPQDQQRQRGHSASQTCMSSRRSETSWQRKPRGGNTNGGGDKEDDRDSDVDLSSLFGLLSARQPSSGGARLQLDDTGHGVLLVNRTALSLKVEAELLGYYDELVPGPGPGARAARPLRINVDLLSYQQARQAVQRGEVAEGVALYKRCVELDPRDGRGWLGLAQHEARRRDYAKARALYETGLRNSPDNPYLLQASAGGLGDAYGVMEERLGNQRRAQELYVLATKVDPTHAASWVALGLLRQRRRSPDEARRCFARATEADPGSYYAWLAWGVLERSLGDTAAARERFRRSARANPRNAAVYQAWGVMEADLGEYAAAEALFRRGFQESGRNTYVLQAWAVMEARRGQSQRAIELFEQAIALRPNDGAAYQAYALLVKGLGDVEGARKLFRRAAERSPRHAPTWQAWGLMEAGLGRTAAAREIFQQGVWACPRDKNVVRILQAWGMLEDAAGHLDDARKCFRFALEADQFCVPAMVAWALMEERAAAAVAATPGAGAADVVASGSTMTPAATATVGAVVGPVDRIAAAEPVTGAAAAVAAVAAAAVAVGTVGAVAASKAGSAAAAAAAAGALPRATPTATDEEALGRVRAAAAAAAITPVPQGLERARELLEAAVRVDSTSVHLWKAYEDMELRSGRVADARRVYERGLAAMNAGGVAGSAVGGGGRGAKAAGAAAAAARGVRGMLQMDEMGVREWREDIAAIGGGGGAGLQWSSD
ncbi:unnamed protein product, partial [Phaeothamnion confervicola]